MKERPRLRSAFLALRKLAFIVFAFALLGPAAAAQSNGTVTVSATVVDALTVLKASDLDFGPLVQGGVKTVSASSPNVGKFAITGEPGTTVSITYSVVTELRDEASNALPFSQLVAVSGEDDGASAVNLSGGSGQVTLSEQGAGYLFLGGSVSALSDQAFGTYSTSIEVSVDYP